MVFNLSEQNSVANQFILELRDKTLQQDRMRFRKNMERLGEIMAYEVSKKFQYTTRIIETPLGKSRINVFKHQPLLITILRAGFPYFQGFINFFDQAEAGFVGAYRRESLHEITIKLDYVSTPYLQGREVILIDPMLATGKSIMDSVEQLLKRGTPEHLHIVSLVAAPEGIKFVTQHVNIPYSLWTCAIDEHLNEQFYIVPGLGDAGDLSYGSKI
ncbi:MAG TPA: uracil phosphoribosyltransferase [Ohtaekwangia sp.]|uniref:uracil phosphoribosyltransferase n=1 Tax=Ohtaekwangia sp. TaxID=2066019 RepID=UPI002F93EB00